MPILKICELPEELLVEVKKSATEVVYTAKEGDANLVCYRTKDNFTHQAEVSDSGEIIKVRSSKPKF